MHYPSVFFTTWPNCTPPSCLTPPPCLTRAPSSLLHSSTQNHHCRSILQAKLRGPTLPQLFPNLLPPTSPQLGVGPTFLMGAKKCQKGRKGSCPDTPTGPWPASSDPLTEPVSRQMTLALTSGPRQAPDYTSSAPSSPGFTHYPGPTPGLRPHSVSPLGPHPCLVPTPDPSLTTKLSLPDMATASKLPSLRQHSTPQSLETSKITSSVTPPVYPYLYIHYLRFPIPIPTAYCSPPPMILNPVHIPPHPCMFPHILMGQNSLLMLTCSPPPWMPDSRPHPHFVPSPTHSLNTLDPTPIIGGLQVCLCPYLPLYPCLFLNAGGGSIC